jgi:hypothetical protein
MALAAVLGAVLVDSTTGSAVMSALRGAAGSPPTTVVSVLPGVTSVVSALPAEEVGGGEVSQNPSHSEWLGQGGAPTKRSC